ncbi:MAG: DNA gyrase inhibitor YacG [Nitrospira sp.]|nr:DNA gyrase inhibitor YacG [Nitrospira sp.]
MKIICPICKNKTTWEENPWRPFCSERCKLIDLGKWITEEYKLAGEKPKEKERAQEDLNPRPADS